MEKKSDHDFFKRILFAFLTTILFFALAVSLFCFWFIHETRKQELKNADSSQWEISGRSTN